MARPSPRFSKASSRRAGWPYLADVARLEWLRHAAFHAADRVPLTASGLAAVPPEQAGAIAFEFHPSAGLIASPYPIVSIWETNAYDEEVRPIGPELPGEAALVIRPELQVTVLRLDPAEYAFAAALAAGETLAEAAAKAAASTASIWAPSLAKLIAAGAFCGFTASPIQTGDTPHA